LLNLLQILQFVHLVHPGARWISAKMAPIAASKVVTAIFVQGRAPVRSQSPSGPRTWAAPV
jgi:hypothetical protein